jgi:hypothetical protein
MTGTMDRFLRSISLRLDVAHPDRFTHFRPTAKSAEVLQAIAGETSNPASLIVAAYGSGKSLAAGAGALLVSNEPEAQDTLSTLTSRLGGVAPQFAEFAQNRVKQGSRGCAIVLEGYQGDVGSALQEEAKARLGTIRRSKAGDTDVIAILEAIARKAKRDGRDRITIIWDEFGRHLEALASSGRAEELAVVQQIAEWAARQTDPQVTFNLLLHQSFFHYAGNLSQSARNSWRKIEGRFEAVRFIEDSREMYELIASVVGQARRVSSLPDSGWFDELAVEARKSGLFSQFKDDNSLARALEQAYPLSPVVLFMLPRLAARLAQNERTVFSFIHDAELSRVVTLKDLYNYFADAMEADTGIGGTHRRWLETESALSKASTEDEEEALAAAALLGLGVSGERTRLKRDTLIFALAAHGDRDRDTAAVTVDQLIERKLLLHRERNDDVSVWHGTDQDIRGRLEEEKLRLEGSVDPVASLEEEHPAPVWRPVAHNVRKRIRRYYTGTYLPASELLARKNLHPALYIEPGEDGRVVYAVPGSVEEVTALRKFATNDMPDDPGLVLVTPEAPVPLQEVVLEIAALRRLQQDVELTSSDPFVLPELQHMLNAARENLADLVSRMVSPGWNGGIWFAQRRELVVRSEGELRQTLSNLADERFPKTPRINNELVVRKKLSKPMVNARKKLLLGVLERTGEAHLGFDAEATTPDVTLYRTVLQQTGLYEKRGNLWTWAAPADLSDAGLSHVWQRLQSFFQEPGTKQVDELIEELRKPPYGVRDGVIPLLIGCALQAFGQAVVVRRDGAYLTDILASEIEALCVEPERFSVEVLSLDEARAAYLRDIVEQFGGTPHLHGDLIRQCYDAIEAWKVQLPDSALRTTKVSAEAREFQKALRQARDPADLLLKRFPKLVDHKKADRPTASEIAPLRQEIEGIIEGFTAAAVAIIRDNLTITPDTDGDTLERAKAWADCFPDDAVPRQALDQTARAVLVRAREATGGRYTEASFARALSAILLQKGLDKWDDRTSNVFADRLREAVERVENAALKAETPSRAMVPLLEGRLSRLYNMLEEVLGPEEAEAAVRRASGKGESAESGTDKKTKAIGG